MKINHYRKHAEKTFYSIAIMLILLVSISAQPNRPTKPSSSLIKKKITIFLPWKAEQIENDLAPFKEKGITQEMLNSTMANILSRKGNKGFYRHRIVDNMLYQENRAVVKALSSNLVYHKIIQNLLNLFDFPDLDFILCIDDGLPLTYLPEETYHNPNAELQAPILVRAKKSKSPFLILIPDRHSFCEFEKYKKQTEQGSSLFPWNKKKEIAFWRGSVDAPRMTEDVKDENGDYKEPRYQICKLASEHEKEINARFVSINLYFTKALEKALNPKLKGNHVSVENHMQYKYLPVLNGRMCTYPGYQWRLLSNSVAFKQDSDEIQWFYTGLRPFEHYVPVDNLMGDLLEKIEWAKENDNLCHQIADNATAFVKEHLMLEDLYVYFYYVFKEYAKLQKFTKEDMIQDLFNTRKWKCISPKRSSKSTDS